jgi:hypothetical protein
MAVCVGAGFVVNPDGSLGLNGPRSILWPYGTSGACTVANANGLRIDTATGNLWAEPPDIRTGASQNNTGSTVTLNTSTQSAGTAVWNLTNPDPCRPCLVVGSVAFTFTATAIPAGTTPKVRADLFTGSPPSIPALNTLTPRWAEQNNSASNQGYTQTITIPFQVQIAAGASLGIQLAVGCESSSASGGSIVNQAWNYAGTLLTQRAVY